MPGIGVSQRTKPRLDVLKGWDPQTPNHFQTLAPVKSGVTIKSGQLISLEWVSANSRWEWALGWEAGRGIPHWAIQDSDQHDVSESSMLAGLSCAGQFRLRTAYFKASPAVPYYEGAILVPDGVTGSVTAVANAANIVGVGVCSNGLRGPRNVAALVLDALPDGNGEVLVVDLDTVYLPHPS